MDDVIPDWKRSRKGQPCWPSSGHDLCNSWWSVQ